MSLWYYREQPVATLEDLPSDGVPIGFVYKITNLTNGKFYIGKKVLHTSRKTKISKTEIKKTKTRKRVRRVTKESDWKNYWGSCQELKDDVKALGQDRFHREILELCCTKKYLNYCEIHWQIQSNVLKVPSYNGNIGGRFYRRDMENCFDDKNKAVVV